MKYFGAGDFGKLIVSYKYSKFFRPIDQNCMAIFGAWAEPSQYYIAHKIDISSVAGNAACLADYSAE